MKYKEVGKAVKVALPARAWIEIAIQWEDRTAALVALPARAWIEIGMSRK